MKKLSFILVVAILATGLFISSCKKDAPEKQYANFVSGDLLIQNGDVTLKTAPVGVTQWLYMYKQLTSAPTFALVNGSEFLTGSAPAIFWSNTANNPGQFPANISVYSNYTPAMQVRMVAISKDVSGVPAYLGILDVNPTYASFPVTIYGKRLGDVLTLNTDALTALPGYTNMSFDVVYTKSTIDVMGTALTSTATTLASWPVYSYSSNPEVTTTLAATPNTGLRTVYDDLDAKITGTITINIHVDATTITVTKPASALGHGWALTLKTDKKGWYDSGTMLITANDITVDAADIIVN